MLVLNPFFPLVALVSLLVAFSFSSLYFKGGITRHFLKAGIWFLLIFIGFSMIGWLLGNAIQPLLEPIHTKAGASLLLMLALKFLIKGIRTKTLKRLFDISRTATMAGLIVMLNLDILLMYVSLPLAFQTSALPVFTTGAVSTVAGLTAGAALGKKAGLLLPNLLEISTAILFGVAGIMAFLA